MSFSDNLDNPNPSPTPAEPPKDTPVVPASPSGEQPPKEAPKPSKVVKKIEISADDFKDRLKRAQASKLQSIFGTTDINEIMGMKKELEDRRKAESEKKLSEMSEIDRLKTLHEEERKKRLDFEKKYKQETRMTAIKGEESRIRSIFTEHIDPQYFKHVARDFAEDLIIKRKLTSEQIAKIGEKTLGKWLSNYLKSNPAFKKQTSATPKEEPKKPATNGGGTTPATPASVPTKDVRPGKANSMSDAEWREYKRKNGFNF